MLCVAIARHGEKIERLLADRNKSPAWLARELSSELKRDITKQSVYQWLNGSTPRNDDVLPAVARILGVKRDIIEDDRLELPEPEEAIYAKKPAMFVREETQMLYGNVALPVWSGVLCGDSDDECFDEDGPRSEEVHAFYVSGRPEDHVICIPKGYSMAPRIGRADRVIVRLDPDVPAGRLVVARSPENKNFIKKLVKGSAFHSDELHSLNPAFAPIRPLDGWVVKGGVIAIIRPYDGASPNIEYDGGAYLRA